MELETAVNLISHERLRLDSSQTWADLGCGRGTFTYALASLLADGSRVYALDKDAEVLNGIYPEFSGTSISTQIFDFDSASLPLQRLDGILMANSLHYVADKESFIRKLEPVFATNPCFLIVEYETQKANPWVPYPMDSSKLSRFFKDMGYTGIEKLGEIPSLYRNKIYATLINK